MSELRMPCFNCGTPWRVISAYKAGHFESLIDCSEVSWGDIDAVLNPVPKGVKIENSQTNEEAFGFEPRW